MHFKKANRRNVLNYPVEGVTVLNSKCYHGNQTRMSKPLQCLLILLSLTHLRYCIRKLHTYSQWLH